MAFPRWYPTATSLADGRVLVIGGSTTCITCIGDIPEVYDPTSNTWTQLGSASLITPLYPQTYLLPDGRILLAAATEGVVQAQTLDLATQTWTVVDSTAVNGGSSVMYRPNLILKSGTGSAPPPRAPVLPSEINAYVLDMNQPSPAWAEVGPMAYPRTYHTLTMLPDGNVLATGGSQTTDPGSQPVYAAEIWDPQTGTWSRMSSMQMARTYHETALLLPDGRVLVGGGGGCCNAPDQSNAEIFSPPYLFKGPRPTIGSAPTSIGYGTQFVVGTPDAISIGSVAVIRLGAVTHQMDRSQNYVPLAFTIGSGVLTVQMPANKNFAPPGDYMLFIVNGAGVPSVASIVRIH
jgi:Galactose oxidase-like, Early set domain/Galactose oxidase, central domain/Kelch motif